MSNITNREYKDRLFKKVFYNKEDLLSLYNAVNGTDYVNPEDIEINTIEDFVYMNMKNDVSFLICDVMNLYEHQSSQNANMPLRGFFYLGELYKGIFENHKDLYSSRMIKLPTPQFLVFYNGRENEPDEKYLYLSDAYSGCISGEPAIECRARMLNINYGHNKELMEKCKRLKEYATLVKFVRDNIDCGMSKDIAITKAVDDCIKEGILKDILEKHRLEVTQMLFTEYDEQAHIDNEKDISFEEGSTCKLIQQVVRKIQKEKNVDTIAAELEEDILEIRHIYDAAMDSAPEYNIKEIYSKLHR